MTLNLKAQARSRTSAHLRRQERHFSSRLESPLHSEVGSARLGGLPLAARSNGTPSRKTESRCSSGLTSKPGKARDVVAQGRREVKIIKATNLPREAPGLPLAKVI